MLAELFRKPSRRLGHLLMLLAFFLGWAAKDVVIKITLSYIEPLDLTLSISLVVVLSSFPIVLVRKYRSDRRTWDWFQDKAIVVKLVLVSITTAMAMYTTIVAIDYIGPLAYSVTDVIAYAMWLSLLSYLFLGDLISRSTVKATAITIIGFVIFNFGTTSEANSLQIFGVLVAAIGSLFWAISLILIKQMLAEGVPPEELVFFRFLLLGLLAVAILPGELTTLPFSVLVRVLLIGVMGYTVLFMIFFYGLKDISTTVVAVFVAAGPLFTAVFSLLLIPGIQYTKIQAAGLAIIMVGLVYAIASQSIESSVNDPV